MFLGRSLDYLRKRHDLSTKDSAIWCFIGFGIVLALDYESIGPEEPPLSLHRVPPGAPSRFAHQVPHGGVLCSTTTTTGCHEYRHDWRA